VYQLLQPLRFPPEESPVEQSSPRRRRPRRLLPATPGEAPAADRGQRRETPVLFIGERAEGGLVARDLEGLAQLRRQGGRAPGLRVFVWEGAMR
jgi:hypothetical protein